MKKWGVLINRLPFPDKESKVREMGGFLMSIDLRCKHDRSLGERAADLFEAGWGRTSVARMRKRDSHFFSFQWA